MRTERDFDSWWDYDDPVATAAKFQARLAEEGLLPYYRLELQTQLARTKSLQRDFAGAQAILDKVKPQLDDAMPVARVRYHLEQGRVFNSAGEKRAARPHFLAAWQEACQVKADFFAVDAAHMLAIVAEPAGQIEWNEKALAYAEASELDRARNWLGSLCNNLGWAYHDLANYEKAFELFEKALAFNIAKDRPGSIRIAKWCVARCLRSLGRLDEALAGQRELEGDDATGYVFEELGELLLLQGDTVGSRSYFARAYELLGQDPWLKANESTRLDRLKELAAE